MLSDQERATFERARLPLLVCSYTDGHMYAEVVSDAQCETFGLSREAMLAALREGMSDYTHPDDNSWLVDATERLLRRESPVMDLVFRNRRRPGDDYHLVHAIGWWQPMADGSEYAIIVYPDMSATTSGIARVFTSFGKSQDDLIYKDPITGLNNLNYMRQFIGDWIAKQRALGRQPMLLTYDVKGMQGYNAQFGYTNGDRLMRVVAEELQGMVRDGQVFRGPDDNFFVLDTFGGDRDRVAEKVRRLNERVARRAYGFTSGLRCGVCLIDEETRSTTAMDRARTALNEIGDDMNVLCRFYSAEKDALYWHRRYIVDSFDRALEERWIRVFYQPIVRTETGKMTVLESLARWIDPSRGLIPPADFIPLLSRYHQTYRLDLYMVEQVCREFAVRRKEDLPILPVSVNFSAQDFDHVNIPDELDAILERYQISHGLIIVEVTEQDIALGSESFRAQLRELRARNYRLWIDDFGSGYSSLNVFSRYEVDRIKFDMDLVRRLDENGGANRRILKAFVNVCRELGVHTLCEGVETKEQLDFLKEIDCEMVQGYYFFQPSPLEDAVFRRRHSGPTKNFETRDERIARCDAWLTGHGKDPAGEP